ncbi:hypothetical protein HMPREF3155_05260 [Corynebacterium sp. HMSC06D04]|uniref:Esterase of the alpha-beta hydrolase superfamily domain protein n=1 Tax=Corynebacterium simulans TaxID=146827 RepID=A0ABR5VAR5_9CORY|nr:esterase of the alpha-beta hydrolase superfamily domain protein [Corynebacterium simulans]OFL97632.1 hypothetical protein HMPREF2724_00810 [Corynebacterium sp. HMSC071F07]OFR40250.1 hypothetical protein HMPREF2888_01380 [Corynebacterium sp. HMSC077D03]OFT34384.1 hypothetical protein HMPREF3169_06490 [Corynebacterium sp. HMSC08C04]OFT51630.1 hypothetical protein HMPREF3155_05260 [Corynebacterium sp. HMSC06D04]OHO70746.1 hypothetical protein HMPREF2692_01845 [Corynebacterium sp. HMSC036D03]
MSSLLRGTGYFKAEYIYERSSDNDLPFDCEAFQANSEEMNLATTRADTGESIYITRDDIHEQTDINMYVRALDVAAHYDAALYRRRVTAMASVSFDSLPQNGAVLTKLMVCGMTHRLSYKDVAVVTIIIPLVTLAIMRGRSR